MTALSAFDPEELALLNRTPTAVAIAAAYAQPDGVISLMREMQAGIRAAKEAATAFPDNELIQALAEAMQEDEGDGDVEAAGDAGEAEPNEVMEERNPNLAAESAIELSQSSMAILEERATIEERIEFKHWLFAIADQVTLAAKSGGFLGLGGTRVTDQEAAFLERLKEALGIE